MPGPQARSNPWHSLRFGTLLLRVVGPCRVRGLGPNLDTLYMLDHSHHFGALLLRGVGPGRVRGPGRIPDTLSIVEHSYSEE